MHVHVHVSVPYRRGQRAAALGPLRCHQDLQSEVDSECEEEMSEGVQNNNVAPTSTGNGNGIARQKQRQFSRQQHCLVTNRKA